MSFGTSWAFIEYISTWKTVTSSVRVYFAACPVKMHDSKGGLLHEMLNFGEPRSQVRRTAADMNRVL